MSAAARPSASSAASSRATNNKHQRLLDTTATRRKQRDGPLSLFSLVQQQQQSKDDNSNDHDDDSTTRVLGAKQQQQRPKLFQDNSNTALLLDDEYDDDPFSSLLDRFDLTSLDKSDTTASTSSLRRTAAPLRAAVKNRDTPPPVAFLPSQKQKSSSSLHPPLLQIPCALGIQSDDSSSYDDSPSTPLHTIIDTGAQVTVLSYQAAQKAGVLHLMERNGGGFAAGIGGNCRVLGRIPCNSLVLCIDGQHYVRAPAILILEHMQVELLLGLDFLKCTRANLCWSRNEMTLSTKIGGGGRNRGDDDVLVVPFLESRDLLHHDDDDDSDEHYAIFQETNEGDEDYDDQDNDDKGTIDMSGV